MGSSVKKLYRCRLNVWESLEDSECLKPQSIVRQLWDLFRWFYDQGLPVVPLQHAKKVPIRKGWPTFFNTPMSDLEVNKFLPHFYTRPKIGRPNIGLVIGPASGLVVVDSDGEEAEAWCRENLEPTPMMTKTRRGWHRFYRRGGEIQALQSPVEGLDIKVKGIVVLPGSLHKSGVTYGMVGVWGRDDLEGLPVFQSDRFETGRTPKEKKSESSSQNQTQTGSPPEIRPPEQVPSWDEQIHSFMKAQAGVSSGQRNNETFRVACGLFERVPFERADSFQSEAEDLIKAYNKSHTPPMDEAEVEAIVSSAYLKIKTKGTLGVKLKAGKSRRQPRRLWKEASQDLIKAAQLPPPRARELMGLIKAGTPFESAAALFLNDLQGTWQQCFNILGKTCKREGCPSCLWPLVEKRLQNRHNKAFDGVYGKDSLTLIAMYAPATSAQQLRKAITNLSKTVIGARLIAGCIGYIVPSRRALAVFFLVPQARWSNVIMADLRELWSRYIPSGQVTSRQRGGGSAVKWATYLRCQLLQRPLLKFGRGLIGWQQLLDWLALMFKLHKRVTLRLSIKPEIHGPGFESAAN